MRKNLLNTYPDINAYSADNVGNRYGQFSPFGFNEAYYYARVEQAVLTACPETRVTSRKP